MFQTIVILIIVGLMFVSSKETKCILLIVSFLCLQLFALDSRPFTSAQNLLIITYCLSEGKSLVNSFTLLRSNKIFWIVVLMLIPTVVLAINSPHYHDTEGIIAILLYEIVLKYLMLWIGFTILTSQYNYKRLYKAAYYALIVLTIFGIINTVIQSAPWISWLGNRNYDAEADLARERFAIKALFTNSFKYGFMCVISLTFFYVGYIRKYVGKFTWYQVLVMCVFGILAHGSRTVLVTSLILVLAVLIAQSNSRKRVFYIFEITISLLLLYYLVPMFYERVNLVIETFDPSNTISGSSIEMRDMQLGAVWYYINDYPVFGRGYRFFYNDLGWGQFHSGGRVDADLRGLEGVHLEYLLERGLFGYISYLLFYISLIIIILKSKGERLLKIMAFTILLLYLSFAHMTGELGTAPIALFYSGLLFRMSLIEKRELKTNYKTLIVK